jgi:hypothetical protein
MGVKFVYIEWNKSYLWWGKDPGACRRVWEVVLAQPGSLAQFGNLVLNPAAGCCQ